MKKWSFETGSWETGAYYNVILDLNDPDLPIVISDVVFPEENTLRLYDVEGVKKLRKILTEIENHMRENHISK